MSVHSEVMKFSESAGIESTQTPLASWCVDPEFQKLDDQILKKHWQFVASVDQLEKPGSYVAGEFCDESYLIVRTENGTLSAFYNVC